MEDMLNEDDHHDDVIHYLQDLSKDELIALGRELGLGNARLSKMSDMADEVTTAWLQMMDDVILGYGEPTYSALASALDETGHSAIAKRIRDNGGKEAGNLAARIADIDIASDHDPAATNSQKSVTTRTVSKISQKEDDDEFMWDRYGNSSESMLEHRPAMDRGEHKAQLKLHDENDQITEISPDDSHGAPISPRGFYSMKAKRHGVALIINNKEFKEHEFREGTDRDEENLIETWRFLGYYIIVFRDRSRDEMARIFAEIDKILGAVKDADLANDSFICSILSHGKEGEVYGSDSQPLEYTKIQRFLARSKILASRPKMLFIQACQGIKTFIGVQDHLKEIDADDDKISVYTDFYLSVASVDGVKSFRNRATGTWFVSELCQTLCKYSTVMDLDDLQKEINKRVVEEHTHIGYKQQPRGIDQLRKKVYFFHH